jgi:excisionase family DNA binding protein
MATERLLWRVPEFAESAGISKSKAYELIAQGEVPSIRVGASTRVPVEAARQWIERKLRPWVEQKLRERT